MPFPPSDAGSQREQTEHRTTNRQETTIVKGFAIVLVLWHHLFGFADRLHGVTWVSIFWLLPGAEEGLLEQHVASFGRIAEPVFLFLTGFGFQRRLADSGIAPTRYALSKLLHLAKAYWICFAVFVPIGLWIPGSPACQLELKQCVLNLVAWHDSLNGESWFVKLYIQVLVFTPLAYHLVVRFPATTCFGRRVRGRDLRSLRPGDHSEDLSARTPTGDLGFCHVAACVFHGHGVREICPCGDRAKKDSVAARRYLWSGNAPAELPCLDRIEYRRLLAVYTTADPRCSSSGTGMPA